MPTPPITVRLATRKREALDEVARQRSIPGNEVTRSDVIVEAIDNLLRREGHLIGSTDNGHSRAESEGEDSKFHLRNQ